jgi:hypothetical protein
MHRTEQRPNWVAIGRGFAPDLIPPWLVDSPDHATPPPPTPSERSIDRALAWDLTLVLLRARALTRAP